MFYFKQFEYVEEKWKMSEYFLFLWRKTNLQKKTNLSFLLWALSLLFIIHFSYIFLDK